MDMITYQQHLIKKLISLIDMSPNNLIWRYMNNIFDKDIILLIKI
jgi:hypothetical protein